MANVIVTMVFEVELGAFKKSNPLTTETPWGIPYAISLGDALEEADELRERLEEHTGPDVGQTGGQVMSDIVERLRQNAEMLKDGHQKNLTELWHSEVARDAATDASEAADEIQRLQGILFEAALQIEYLHGKFKVTGTGEATLARIRAALPVPSEEHS